MAVSLGGVVSIIPVLRAWESERIILFGSHARGDARPDSDLDILVVLPDRQPATRAIVVDMRVAIGSVPTDYDLLITSHSEYAWRRNYVGTIEYPANREGIEPLTRRLRAPLSAVSVRLYPCKH
ncbi:MAG: nucleotidyltransferase domain-containing protein [Acidobacteria bacterium]|nr:nucleotidyltransferase domain-containing protein [Acidobacteriota bacterium]